MVDFNRDGREDLLVGAEDGSLRYFQREEGSGFQSRSGIFDHVQPGPLRNPVEKSDQLKTEDKCIRHHLGSKECMTSF